MKSFRQYCNEEFSYVEESSEGTTLKDYPHLHKHVAEKQKKQKLPAHFMHNVGDTPVHPKSAAAHKKADSALSSGHPTAKRRADDVYRGTYDYEGSAERRVANAKK